MIKILLRIVCLLALTGPIITPMMARALCEGTDLIDTLPRSEYDTISNAAQAQPFSKGLLWKAEKGDTAITIFGTYHFAHDQTDAHLRFLTPMIEAADVVYLEINEEDSENLQSKIAQDPSLMFYISDPKLSDLLGDPDWEKYSQAMAARGLPEALANEFKPFWASVMLSFGPCEMRNGALNGGGIDELIGKMANELGTPNASLEDFELVLKIFDDLPEEEQLDMIRITLNMSDDPDDLAYTLRHRYLTQEVALVWEFSRWQAAQYGQDDSFADFEERLLTQRNHNWLSMLMDNAMDHQAFMAVGAAHLPGKNGMLQLLQDQGFTITALPFEPDVD